MVEQGIERLSRLLWGWPVWMAILVFGVWFTIKSRGFQFTHCIKVWKYTLFSKESGKKSGISSKQALSAALAGSVGTGNLAGVGAALLVGGPGAIFWMWISALFGMATIFCEVILAMQNRSTAPGFQPLGGAMVTLSRRLHSPVLAGIFAVGCIGASLGMGCLAQVHAAVPAAKTFSLSPLCLGILISAVLFVGFGGLRRTVAITEKLVPVMTAFFLGMCLWVLLCRWDRIPGAAAAILQQAFDLRAVGSGGACGLFLAMKTGVTRGIFTNEAGLGSAVFAYAGSEEKDPVRQGCWGIVQVMIDTLLMCTLTALCLLVSGIGMDTESEGAAYCLHAFAAVLGPWGEKGVSLCTVLFAFATLFAWQCYGRTAWRFLFRGRGENLYRLLFAATALWGVFQSENAVWALSDACNGLMALPNLVMLYRLWPEAVVAVKDFCKKERKEKDEHAFNRRFAPPSGAEPGSVPYARP